MNTFVVDFTQEQSAQLHPYLASLKPGETMFAQVYGDGMRVKKLTPSETDAIVKALDAYPCNDTDNSAHDAQARALRRARQ